MKALLKIEWIKTWRSWPVFIMSIGMPVGFFLLYSGMEMGPDPEPQKAFILSYMLIFYVQLWFLYLSLHA